MDTIEINNLSSSGTISKIAVSALCPCVQVLAKREAMTTPTLKLRRLIWHDGNTSIESEDYEVIDARGEEIGRMYRTIAVGGGQAWNWTVYGIAAAGQAPTREAAQAALKAAWATYQLRGRDA
jgi:hypothetical protein